MILPPLPVEPKSVVSLDVRTAGDIRADDDRALLSAETETVTITIEALAALMSSGAVTGAAASVASPDDEEDAAVSKYVRAKLHNVRDRRPDGCVGHLVTSFRACNPDRALWVRYARWIVRGAR